MSTVMNVDATKDDEIADEDLIDPAVVIEPPPEMKSYDYLYSISLSLILCNVSLH